MEPIQTKDRSFIASSVCLNDDKGKPILHTHKQTLLVCCMDKQTFNEIKHSFLWYYKHIYKSSKFLILEWLYFSSCKLWQIQFHYIFLFIISNISINMDRITINHSKEIQFNLMMLIIAMNTKTELIYCTLNLAFFYWN